jgi:putative PIN family toxin of toxin-antitoxin system
LPSTLLGLAKSGLFQLISSPVLIDELTEKLRSKFRVIESDIDETQIMLEGLCEIVSTTDGARVILADPDDDRVIECAIAGRADYIVTGDRHLLDLGSCNSIAILTVRQFLDNVLPKF